MFILHMEHPVLDFKTSKIEDFDSDPLDRKGSGVRRYTVSKSIEDPERAIIDLTFDSLDDAQATLIRLNGMWDRVSDRFGWTDNPQVQIVEVVEDKILDLSNAT